MEFTIYWTECHNPLNWSSDLPEKVGWLTRMKTGIRKMKDCIPVESFTFDQFGGRSQGDDWVQLNCKDTFTAKDIEEAKKRASEYDIPDSIFTVYDTQSNKRLFTEEDLE